MMIKTVLDMYFKQQTSETRKIHCTIKAKFGYNMTKLINQRIDRF